MEVEDVTMSTGKRLTEENLQRAVLCKVGYTVGVKTLEDIYYALRKDDIRALGSEIAEIVRLLILEGHLNLVAVGPLTSGFGVKINDAGLRHLKSIQPL